MTTRRRKNIIIAILLIMVIGMTIAYSALTSYLTINGTSNITSDFRVVITNITEGTMNDSETINKTYDETSATFQVDLKKPGSNAEYIVTVQNLGKLDATLDTIEGINEANNKTPNEINFSLEGITVGDSLNVGETKTFKVKVNYNELATTIPSTSKTLTLKLNYKQKTTIDTENPVNTLLAKTNNLLEKSESTYNYMDGTYLGGAQDSNYVWFNGFLWRIMGVNADGSIRMITEENVTAISWGAGGTAEDYDSSYANDWLNNYFYPKLKDKDLFVKQTWCSETTADTSSVRATCENNLSKEQEYIGLISVDEYNLAGSQNSYLVNAQTFFTLTPVNSLNVFSIRSAGIVYSNLVITNVFGIRPIISLLENTIIVSGNGTITDPYMFEEKSRSENGTLKDNSQIGEYVTYAGRNYRVVETSYNGTKLILDGYYDSNNDGIIEETDKIIYGENCTLCTTINDEKFLNWISKDNEYEKQKLFNTTWYIVKSYDYGANYVNSLNNINNPYVGKIGLIRIGEIFSVQSESILSKNHFVVNNISNVNQYYTANLASNNVIWCSETPGFVSVYSVNEKFAVRPVINIGPDVQILSGNGTFNSPYQI